MEITVTTREMIKPTSPTPHHLKKLKLSLIDQYMHWGGYCRILLFYSAQGDASRFHNTNMSGRLKKSLSEVLMEFYPLAGTYHNNETIECNDRGLEYIEARVKAPHTLEKIVTSAKAEELDQLIPYDEYTYGTGFKGLSAAQVTVFEECGSLAIGVSISHKVGDISALAMFVNVWGAIARGRDAKIPGGNILSPKFGFSSLFPQRDILRKRPEDENYIYATEETQPKLITKRFVFRQSKIDTLRTKFMSECPTRVEAVSALIFRSLIKIYISRSLNTIAISMPVNLRGRLNPPLPMHCISNLAIPWVAEQIGDISLNDLGVLIRKMVKQFDSNYLKRLQGDNALLLFEYMEHLKEVYRDSGLCLQISSWCKFPFYEVDVGWGTPAWVATIYLRYAPEVLLLDAKNGDGIEAWVTLDEEKMAQLETDKEFLYFTSPDSRL